MLRDAVDPQHGSDELIRRFYTRWFAIDLSVRDLFPPDMDAQRSRVRPGDDVAVLASSSPNAPRSRWRSSRSWAVITANTVSRNGITTACRMRCYTTLRSHLIDSWDDRLAEAARDALALIIGVMRGAADAETGPAVLRRHRRRAPPGIPRHLGDPAAARPADVLPPRAVRHRPGAAVAAAVALPESGDTRRPRRRDRISHPVGHRRHGQHRDRRRNPARRPVAAVQPARRHADRPRRR